MRFINTGVLKFACACAVVVAVWMLVLPVVGDFPSVRQRIEGNRAAGINPTAVFYTDHPAMADIERSIAAKVNAPTGSFWQFSARRPK
ncbi:MAG: hypothetical protein NTW52_16195 [Planctomycetota bacterium]|nr:hypothetical protein [Planctomycetota bacterium]